jgi:hypothetical protein
LLGSTAATGIVLELATNCVERVANGDVRLFVGVVQPAVPIDDELAPGKREGDANIEELTLVLPLVPAFDRDVAGNDPRKKLLEFGDPRANAFFQRRRRAHMEEGDLKRRLHPRVLAFE